ncbi:MAG TPA: hypothetical protein VIX80_07475 [Candidatus Kapabacteria bacterium]
MKIQKTIGSILRILLALQLVITTTASAQHEVFHVEEKTKTECSDKEHSSDTETHHTENCVFCAHGSVISESSSAISFIVILPATESEVESPSFHISHTSEPLPSLRGPPSVS